MDVSASEMADALRALSDTDLLDRASHAGGCRSPSSNGPRTSLPSRAPSTCCSRPSPPPGTTVALPGTRQAPARLRRFFTTTPAAADLLTRLISLLRGDPAAGAGEFAAEVISAFGGLDTGQAATRSGTTSTGSCGSST